MGKIGLSSETDTALIEATNVLESGGVVIFPTDTAVSYTHLTLPTKRIV